MQTFIFISAIKHFSKNILTLQFLFKKISMYTNIYVIRKYRLQREYIYIYSEDVV